MKRALVLNAGLSWGAYQIGALRYLVRDRQLRFDLCAGSGIGAINAALIAVHKLETLEAFWNRIGPTRLLGLNLRSGMLGFATDAPLRRFIAEHVSEAALAQLNARLLVNVFNLQTGREQLFEYPGADLPLVDAVMAAVATPGLCPPVLHQGEQLAEGTFVRGFLAHTVAERPFDEIYAVAASLLDRPEGTRRYRNFREVMQRAFEMNQSHDVRQGRHDAEETVAASAAFLHVRSLPEQLARRIEDVGLAARVRERVAAIYDRSHFPSQHEKAPQLHFITPSKHLDYPPWRFRQRELASARALGYDDAVRLLGHDAGAVA